MSLSPPLALLSHRRRPHNCESFHTRPSSGLLRSSTLLPLIMEHNSFLLTSSELFELGYFDTIKFIPSLWSPTATIIELYNIYCSHLKQHRLLFERIHLLITTHTYREEFSSSSFPIDKTYHCDPPIFWGSIRKALLERGVPVCPDDLSDRAKYSVYKYYYTQVHSPSSTIQFNPTLSNSLAGRLSFTPRCIPHQQVPHRFRPHSSSYHSQSQFSTATSRVNPSVPSLLTLRVPTPTPVTRLMFVRHLHHHVNQHFPSRLFFVLFLQRSIKHFRTQH
jgi:hypothetical protein